MRRMNSLSVVAYQTTMLELQLAYVVGDRDPVSVDVEQ